MVLVSIDPHTTHYDFAVFRYDKLIDHKSVKESIEIISLVPPGDKSVFFRCCIENQYLAKNLQKKISIIKLAQAAGEIAGMMKSFGYKDIKYVDPGKWKPAMLTGIIGQTENERVNYRTAMEFPGVKFKNVHQCEAALMGRYYLLNRRF